MENMPARYCIALDIGDTLLKGVLIERDETAYRLVRSMVAPHTVIDQVLPGLISMLREGMSDEVEMVVVGETVGISQEQVLHEMHQVTRQEAVTAILRRTSSNGGGVLVDIGSRTTLLAQARYGKVVVDQVEEGVGHKAWDALLVPDRAQRVRQWLPLDLRAETVEDYIANKSLYPNMIPTTPREQVIEQALAKLILAEMPLAKSLPWESIDHCLVSGGVAAAVINPGLAASVILDGLQPIGVCELIIDTKQILLALGAFLAYQGNDAYHLGRRLLQEALTSAGTLVGLTGANKQLERVWLDTGLSMNQEIRPSRGELVRVPLPQEELATLTIATNRRASGSASSPRSVSGGDLGVVIDARGRPIVLPQANGERQAQLLLWDRQLNAHQQVPEIGADVS